MKLRTILCTAAVLGYLMVPAAAFTLVNEDQTTYTVDYMIGEGDATNGSFELEYDFAADDFCDEGCTIRLNNGAEMGFAGHENVAIRDGKFVIIE